MRRMTSFLVVALALVLGGTVSPALAKGPITAEQAEAVRAYVRDALKQLGIPGAAVVIVSPDGIEFAEGFGNARDDGSPVTPQTPFHVASLSKQLTSIAVMQLIESGDLRLEEPVRSYIDWFPAQVTIRDLLAQTSGYSTEQGLTYRIDEYDADDALERIARRLANEGPANAIGQFEYSNANYDILGYLVAVASGRSYEAYMTEQVMGPLQMTDTYLTDAAAREGGVAQGHYPFFGMVIGYDIPFVRSTVPSSFIAASAEDLGHVLIAHLNDGAYEGVQVLDADAMAALRIPLTHPDPWDGYGWGWWTFPLWDAGALQDGANPQYEVPIVLEHTGGHSTYASAMALIADEEVGVVVLMNLNDDSESSRFYQLHTGILQILLGRDAPALTSTGDFLGQNGRLIGLAWLVLLIAYVVRAARRHRGWHRDPRSAPRGAGAILRSLVLPLAIVVAQLVALLLLLESRGVSIAAIPRVARLDPDLGLMVITVSVVSLVWIVVGTISTIVLLRGNQYATEVA